MLSAATFEPLKSGLSPNRLYGYAVLIWDERNPGVVCTCLSVVHIYFLTCKIAEKIFRWLEVGPHLRVWLRFWHGTQILLFTSYQCVIRVCFRDILGRAFFFEGGTAWGGMISRDGRDGVSGVLRGGRCERYVGVFGGGV